MYRQMKTSRGNFNAFVICIAATLVFISAYAGADDVIWTGSSDNLWDNSANWSPGKPDVDDYVYIGADSSECKIAAGVNAACTNLVVSDDIGPDILYVTGGKLTVTKNNLSVGYWKPSEGYVFMADGIIDITGTDGGWESGNLRIGHVYDGCFQITGGSVNVSRNLIIPENKGSGELLLYGGVITANSLERKQYESSETHIDITQGKLILRNAVESKINDWVNLGFITAYGGDSRANIVMSRGDNGYLTIEAVIDESVNPYYLYPQNGAVGVARQPIFKWLPVQGSSIYDLYLGTDYESVANADRNSAQYFNADSMTDRFAGIFELNKKYYWRIDACDLANPDDPVKGQVWNFTTDDAVASDADNNGVTDLPDLTILAQAWLTGSVSNEFNPNIDHNSDEKINFGDFSDISREWQLPVELEVFNVDYRDEQGTISTKLTGWNSPYGDELDSLWKTSVPFDRINEIGSEHFRYPGGETTSHYHWNNLTGHNWSDSWSPTYSQGYRSGSVFMNVDEYLLITGNSNLSPMIGINIESGQKYNRQQDSIDEAVALVQHCAGQGVFVPYWFIDNESSYAQTHYQLTATEYANLINIYAPLIKQIMPSAEIIANWTNNLNFADNDSSHKKLMDIADQNIDIVDSHWYWQWGSASWDMWLNQCPMSKDGKTYTQRIRDYYKQISDRGYTSKLASLEYGIGDLAGGETISRYQRALMESEMLLQFFKGGLFMACNMERQSELIHFSGINCDPLFGTYKLFAKALGQQLLSGQCDDDTIPSFAAKTNDSRTLLVYLINKNESANPKNILVNTPGFDFATITVKSFVTNDLNSGDGYFTSPDAVRVTSRQCIITLPPHSFSLLIIDK